MLEYNNFFNKNKNRYVDLYMWCHYCFIRKLVPFITLIAMANYTFTFH